MRIAIVGAGAIGCHLGARLCEAGHDATLVGRREQVEAIRSGGLRLELPDGTERRYELEAVTALEETPDLVLLTVKTQDLRWACEEVRDAVRAAPVVAMQNGIRGDSIAAEALGRSSVLGGVVMCAATYLEHGRVTVQFPGWLIVGEPFEEPTKRTHWVVDVLGSALPTYLTRNLIGTRWSKLISNLNNGLCAATGLALTEVVADPVGARLCVRVMREGYAVARAEGVKLDHGLYGLAPATLLRSPGSAMVAVLQGSVTTILDRLPEGGAARLLSLAARGSLARMGVRGSTWQSIARGRRSEIDYLNGEVSRLGRRHRLPTPYNDHLVDVVHVVESTRQFCTLEELIPPEAGEDLIGRSPAERS